MKKITFLLFFMNVFYFNAQMQRLTFEFAYKIDSLENDIERDIYLLDITKDDTKFYKEEFLQIDSLNQNLKYKTQASLPNGFNILVKRKTGQQENKNYSFINGQYYVFETVDKIKWTLKDQKKSIGNYTAQLAESDYGGRHWYAWFVKDLPLIEGPYKFNGLPGMVIEVYDSQRNFSFTLTSLSNLKELPDTQNILETNFGQKPIKVSLEKFNKALINAYYNLYSEFKNDKTGRWSINTEDGRVIKSLQELNSLIREEQAEIRKNYNPINKNQGVKYPIK